MKRLMYVLSVVFILVILSLVGCSKKDNSANETTAPATTAVTVAPTTAVGTTEPTASPAATFDPFGKYDPPIDLTAVNVRVAANNVFPPGDSASSNIWTRTYLSELGIKTNVLWGSNDSNKFNLMVASGELPDLYAVNGDSPQFDQLVANNQLADLTDVYNEYATPLVKEMMTRDGGRTLKATMRNGKMYSIPWWSDPIDQSTIIWVREDWRKKLKLPEPKTMNDVLAIADAFATKDPDGDNKADTTGLYVSGDGTYPDGYKGQLYGFFAGFHAYPGIWVEDASGNLVSGKTQSEVIKPALKALQDLYKKNEIPKEFALKKGEQFPGDTLNGTYGLIYGEYYYAGSPIQDLVNKDPKADWKAYPIVSADAKPAMVPVPGLSVNYYFVVNKNYKHPEAVIKMLNLATEKISGPNADVTKYANDDKSAIWKYTLVSQSNPRSEDLAQVDVTKALASNDPSKLAPQEKDYYDHCKNYLDNGKVEDWGYCVQFGPEGSIKNYLDYEADKRLLYDKYTGPQTPTMLEKQTTLDLKFNDEIIKIILGADVNDFDNFVTEWKKLGGDQITKEVNDWYAAQPK